MKKLKFHFLFQCQFEAPLTLGMKTVWIHTGLDIKHSIDPSDRDYVQVLPNALLSSVLDSVNELGFKARHIECEELPHRLRKQFHSHKNLSLFRFLESIMGN